MSFFRFALIGTLILMVAPAQAARVSAAGVTASSSYPPEKGVRYDAKQAMDAKLASCWVEGDQGSGLGSWLELDLGSSRAVDTVKIWAGMWYSYDLWTRANRPKTIELRFSDGSSSEHSLEDKMEVQVIKLSKPINTSSIRLRVKAIYNGTTWFDTAISEVQVLDSSPDPHKTVTSYASSSELPEDGDGNYKPLNVSDGLGDSMWCEGNKEGDGTGEWLQFNFGSSQSIGNLTLINGIGSSFGVWMKGNRAAEATLEFSDGSTEKVVIKNSIRSQTIPFSSHSTKSVKMTFTKVMKGKEYNDLCVSEVYFSP